MHTIGGAVTLFLDLSRAFDSIDRNRLFCKLHSYGVDPRIAKLLAAWHQESDYIVSTGSESTSIPISKGVRQGCKAAPWLWNMFIRILIDDLTPTIPAAWIRDQINIFADDLEAGDTFTSMSQLAQILGYFGHILTTLQDFGLVINLTKSHVLFSVTGKQGKQCRDLHTSWRDGSVWLKIPGADTPFLIPIVRHVKYLGVIISHHNSADLTIRHRHKLASIAYGRLARWLQSRHGLTLHERFRIWTTCVFPVAVYGLFTTGLTHNGALQLQQLFNRMIRKMVGDHSYITGHSNLEIFCTHQLPAPLLLLWRAADQFRRSVTDRRQYATRGDIILTQDWTHLNALCDMLWTLHISGDAPSLPGEPAPFFSCHWCSFQALTITALRRHYTVEHGCSIFRTRIDAPARHMVNGLPTCKHCLTSFSSWRNFYTHVQRGCQALQAETTLSSGSTADLVPMISLPAGTSRLDEAIRGTTLLSANDLQHMRQQEWGPRLLNLIQHRQWHLLRNEPNILEALSQKCCLCGQWVGRSQEMHKHLRIFHAKFWPDVLAKSTQLSNTYADESPCAYCQTIFRHSHQCNTWTQVSLLWLYGAGSVDVDPCDRHPTLLCEICDREMATPEDMHLHLMQDHKLPSARWNPSRDTVDGMPACAHCGQAFTSMSSVRSHISQGRCPHFDPKRTSEPKEVDHLWQQAMCGGQLYELLRNPAHRRHLTLHCQCCHASYHRAADLMLHLMSSHPALWKASEPLSAILVALFYGTIGCVCNPATAVRRLNHVCLPLKQLAMQYMRLSKLEVFMPVPITEEMLLKVYHPDTPRNMKFAIDQLLIHRDFHGILQDDNMMHHLSSICLQCGEVHSAADLGLHLREAHGCTTPLISFFVEQILPWMLHLNTADHTCFACRLVFNLPMHTQIGEGNTDAALAERQRLEYSHFRAQCPALLQLAASLTLAFNHGRPGHDGWLRCNEPDTGHLPEPGPSPANNPGQGPETRTKPRGNEASSKRRRLQGQGQEDQARRRADSAEQGQRLGHTDQAGAAPRPGDSVTSTGGHLPLLFRQQHQRRQSTGDAASGRTMASACTGGATAQAMDPTPTETDADPAAGTPEATHSAGGGRPSVTIGAHGSGEQHPPGGHDLSLPGLESPAEEAGGGLSVSHHPEEDDPEHTGAAGDVHRSLPHQGLPCPSPFGTGDDHSVEATDEHTSGQRVSADAVPVREQHLGAHGHQSEGAQSDTQRPGCPVGTSASAAEGTGEDEDWEGLIPDRLTLLTILTRAQLANPNNWCFCNSTVLAFLWVTLTLGNFHGVFWGKQCNALYDFVLRLSHATGNLSTETWFHSALQRWGRSELNQHLGSISQHDAAEFIGSWIHQLNTTAFKMRWERRVEENGQICLVDSSADHLPLFFQFFTQLQTRISTTDVSALASTWRQVDGMVAALTQPTLCVCIHIDRCIQQTAQSEVTKCATAITTDEECLLPVFTSPGLTVEFLEYSPIALQAHVGGDGAGHYRTAIKVQQTVIQEIHPANWLLCDDGTAPQPVWELPDWFRSNITLMWLVRTDCAHPYSFQDREIQSSSPSVTVILDLLQQLTATTTAENAALATAQKYI